MAKDNKGNSQIDKIEETGQEQITVTEKAKAQTPDSGTSELQGQELANVLPESEVHGDSESDIPGTIKIIPGQITLEQIYDLDEVLQEAGYQIIPLQTEKNPEDTDLFDEEFEEQADKHMKAQNLTEIWRCPISGYWFSRKDYASARAKEIKRPLEHYHKRK